MVVVKPADCHSERSNRLPSRGETEEYAIGVPWDTCQTLILDNMPLTARSISW